MWVISSPKENVLDEEEKGEAKNLINKNVWTVEVVPTKTEQEPLAVRKVVPSVVLSAGTSSINWKTYPYDSNDTYTLKNRANKVKERILGCSTSNSFNKLLFLGKVTEIESNWLVDNYFTDTENLRFRQILNSTQGNLFSAEGTEESESESVIELEFAEIMEAIDKKMNRLGWSSEDGKKYLIEKYNKKSRRHLTDEELLEFWDYLKSLPTSLREEE